VPVKAYGSLGSKEIFCLVHVNRHFVLRTLGLKQLELSHCFRLAKSWVRDENNSLGSLEANARLASSAYILASDRTLLFGRPLMYNNNSSWWRIESPSISFKRDKNVGNFLVRSVFQTSEQPGTFKCARVRCKSALLILRVLRNAFHSTNLFSCFSRYQAPTNSVAPYFCI